MSRPPFDYYLDFKTTDFRRHPERYRIGKGEQGVLLVEPYRSEILPHWRFGTVAEAEASSARIFAMFVDYLRAGDLPGAHMARKFLRMGWTRARRYANHPGGRKYDKATGAELPRTLDVEKAAASAVFYKCYVAAREQPEYRRQAPEHRQRYESGWARPRGVAPPVRGVDRRAVASRMTRASGLVSWAAGMSAPSSTQGHQ